MIVREVITTIMIKETENDDNSNDHNNNDNNNDHNDNNNNDSKHHKNIFLLIQIPIFLSKRR